MGQCVEPAFPGLLSISLALAFHWPLQASLASIHLCWCFLGFFPWAGSLEVIKPCIISSTAIALITIYLLTTPRFITANPISSLSFRLVDISMYMYQTPRTQQKWVHYPLCQCSGLPQIVITKSCRVSFRDNCQSFHFSTPHSYHQFRLTFHSDDYRSLLNCLLNLYLCPTLLFSPNC